MSARSRCAGITAERVARAAYRGYRRGKREVVVPWTMIPAIKLYQLLPGLVGVGDGQGHEELRADRQRLDKRREK